MIELSATVDAALAACRGETVELWQHLVRFPSVNRPPTGDERAVQDYYAAHLRRLGLAVETIDIAALPGFDRHPGRLASHDLHDRPDVVGVWKGAGGGRSLLLVAHADVELPGEAALWTGGNPFNGELRDGRVYGRGVGDDKSGMAIAAGVVRVLQAAGIQLHGDLLIASVADEEQAGSNGAVALACTPYRADACVNIDGVNHEVWLTNLGGGSCRVEFVVPTSTVDATVLLEYFDRFRACISAFLRQRMAAFASVPEFAGPPFSDHSVRMMDIRLAGELTTHGSCLIWFYLLPGEEPATLQAAFGEAVGEIEGPGSCRLHWMPRFLLPSRVSPDDPFARTVLAAAAAATGKPATTAGGMMSDMGMLNAYVVSPCVSVGPSRWGGEGSAHQVDEYVEVDDFLDCLKTVVYTAMHWCGWSPTAL